MWAGFGSGEEMSAIRQRRRRGRERRSATLETLAAEPFPSADLVLLCSFGDHLDRTRTRLELLLALRLAGYHGPLGRHVILTSPLLRRCADNHYCLHSFLEQARST